ncbi:MAG: CRTAC1 family protein [Terracidiphilus sp.]
MPEPGYPSWTRRRLLQTGAIAGVRVCVPGLLRASQARSAILPPFSRFTDVAAQAGLTQPIIYGTPGQVTYILESMGGGCAFFDYDNDGWIDIFLLGGRTLSGTPPGSGNRLYHNNRDGTFTDVTAKSGLNDPGWANGVCVGDYNNDGLEDLFLTYYGHNRLYQNNGDGTFTDVTARAGLLHSGNRFGTGCTFLDYNRDGHLDLFVANYVDFDLATAPRPTLQIATCQYQGVAVYCGPRGLPVPTHALYRNNGDGTFTDISTVSGIDALKTSYGLTAVSLDVDEDGWPDIVVAADSTPSLLLMNNHDGTFREEALLRGLAVSSNGQEMAGMGIAAGDYNLDGHIDIFKTHYQQQSNGLYRAAAKGDFDDVTIESGIGIERRFVSWGDCMLDLDNDGWPDIFYVTGNVYPELERVFSRFPARSQPILFRNLRNGQFVEIGDEAGPAFAAKHCSRGCAFGDFDNDGDIDILIMNQNEPPSLLRNDAPPRNNWIKLRLEGTKSNRSAIGARVLVRYGENVQAQQVMSQASYLSANDPRLHFGLGPQTSANVEVHWPSGAIENYKALHPNQLVTILEGTGVVKGRSFFLEAKTRSA